MMRRGFYEDKSMANKIKLRNKSGLPLHGQPAGSVFEVDTDHEGIPLDRNWRNRLRDSAIDDCVEIVKDEAPAPVADDTAAEPAEDKPARRRRRNNEE